MLKKIDKIKIINDRMALIDLRHKELEELISLGNVEADINNKPRLELMVAERNDIDLQIEALTNMLEML